MLRLLLLLCFARTTLAIVGSETNARLTRIPLKLMSPNDVTDAARMNSELLRNFLNIQYSAQISLGTPEQNFTVVLDTGSSDFFVPSLYCFCPACEYHKRFDACASVTYKRVGQMFDFTYASGQVMGTSGRDTLKFAGLTVVNQTFGEIVCEMGKTFRYAHYDGVVGLGYPGIAKIHGDPVFDNIMKQKLLEKQEFSFYFSSTQDPKYYSELVLGGKDDGRYLGPLTWHPVTNQSRWQLHMERVAMKGLEPMCVGGCEIVVATGTARILGPSADIDRINNLIGAIPSPLGELVVNCSLVDTFPDITFTLGQTEYTLTGEQYIVKFKSPYDGMEICVTGFRGTEDPVWTLGSVFLRVYYSVFNRQHDRIGLALARTSTLCQ